MNEQVLRERFPVVREREAQELFRIAMASNPHNHSADDEVSFVSRGAGSIPDPKPDHTQALLDLLPVGLIFADRRYVVLCANARAHELLGKPAGALIGKRCRVAVNLYRDSSADEPFNIQDELRTTFERGASRSISLVLRPHDPDSQFIELDVTLMPLARNRKAWGVAIQMSPQVSATDHEHELLSLVSHELRTPLLHIKGFVSSLLEEDVTWDAETQLDFLRTVDRETDRLTAIVTDLLEISRMGSVETQLDLEKFGPQLLAYTGVDEASPFLSRHRVDVTVLPDLPPVMVDRTRMTSVFVNLLENAVKYSPEGTTIEVGARLEDGFVVFWVSDQGVGISAAMLDRVFDLFMRGPTTGSQARHIRPTGSGLGLSLCRSVVKAHGGRIWVESELGQGSTFYFTVPVAQSS